MPSLRLFLAIDSPPDVRTSLGEFRDRLKSSGADVRWEQTGKLHLTLRFLGDVEDSLLRDFVPLIGGVARRFPPFTVRYRGSGCFPGPRDPRIIWAGVEDPSGILTALQGALEDAVRGAGFEPERKRFHAHVTLGRVKSRKGVERLLRMLESAIFEGPSAAVNEFVLMRSTLRPDGSVYSVLNAFPLAPGRGGGPAAQDHETHTS